MNANMSVPFRPGHVLKGIVGEKTGSKIMIEILGRLGAGGQGDILAARDLRDGNEVALKVFPEMDCSTSTGTILRDLALREATLNVIEGCSSLVQSIDYFEYDNRVCIVMKKYERSALDVRRAYKGACACLLILCWMWRWEWAGPWSTSKLAMPGTCKIMDSMLEAFTCNLICKDRNA